MRRVLSKLYAISLSLILCTTAISMLRCSQPTTVVREVVTPPNNADSTAAPDSTNEDSSSASNQGENQNPDGEQPRGSNPPPPDCTDATRAGGECTATCGVSSAPQLLLTLRMSEASGIECTDASEQQQPARIYGDFERVESPCGGALDFNGTNTRVTATDALDTLPGNEVTLETWVRLSPDQPAHYPHLLAGGANNYRLSLSPGESSHRILWRLEINGSIQSVWYTPDALPENEWFHLAATYNGQEMVLYINAVPVARKSVEGDIDYARDLQLGSWDELEQTFFKGALDEIRVWSRARNAQELCSDAGGQWVGQECSYVELSN